MTCLQQSLIVPGDNVIHMDVMYAANAGAIGSNMGLSNAQVRSMQT
jgi:hypothetical protein